ncbi:sensor histidine kinase [Massilia niastensis]|uniref:sensor histidine kinase n=1 Tax=Massilia niastensis TaxID=544911 RepID=UPI00035DB907|nr:histidine kinase [Massilia niastensis]
MSAAPIRADGGAVRAALRRTHACTPLQLALSAACGAACLALAWALQADRWLGLFGALLLPILCGSAGMNGALRLRRGPVSWTAAWLLLALGAAIGLLFYRHWLAASGQARLSDQQVLAAALGVGALALGLPLWRAQIQYRAQQIARLQQAALAAELKTLQAQIEPHFLYNTLANTRYLTRHDPDKAGRMLEHLIAYLHSALPDMRADSSTVGREVELARHYLALVGLRFGERLRVEIAVPEALAGLSLPPLMLMTLVENAVRHGLERQPGEVRIQLRAAMRGSFLLLTVADDGPGIGNAVLGNGVGLRNLRERLAALYGGAAGFDLLRTDAGQTEARLTIPCARAAAA